MTKSDSYGIITLMPLTAAYIPCCAVYPYTIKTQCSSTPGFTSKLNMLALLIEPVNPYAAGS